MPHPVLEASISPLRQRLIDDMNLRRFSRELGRLATFLRRSPDTATTDDLCRFQIEQQDDGVPVPTMNSIVSALRFFFTQRIEALSRVIEWMTSIAKSRRAAHTRLEQSRPCRAAVFGAHLILPRNTVRCLQRRTLGQSRDGSLHRHSINVPREPGMDGFFRRSAWSA